MTGGRLGAALLAGSLVLGGCGGGLLVSSVPAATLPPESLGTSTSDRAGTTAPVAVRTSGPAEDAPVEDADLVDLVARMDAVLADGTEEEWAAFFEGGQLVEQQRRWWRAVQDVPMDVRDLLPDAVVERDGDEEGPVVELVFAHQVSGADPVPAAQAYRATVVRGTDGVARVSGMTGTEGPVGRSQLWDLDEVDVTVTGTLVLLAPQDRAEEVAALLPGLESAVANAVGDFGEGGERLVVQLADGQTLLRIAADDDLAVDPAGVTMSTPGVGARPADGELGVGLAQEHLDRIVLDMDLLVDELDHGTPPGGWGLMRHEAVHALVDGEPGVLPPVWVWEGLAEWYGYRRDYLVDEAYRQVVAADGGTPLELPDSFSDYYYDSQEAGELAYASSAMVFSFLEERHGFATARDVGVRLTTADTWRDTAAADAVLQDLTGLTLEGLEQEWAAWAVATYG